MIRKVREGEINWLPGLTPSDIPVPLPTGISLHIRQNELGLEVQGVVGAIPLCNGDTLQITPKIGQVNFLRLLFKAEGYQHDLENEYKEFVQYSIDDEVNVDLIVARHLFYCAEEIIKRSPLNRRIRRRHIGSFASGHIDPVATSLNIACRKEDPVVYLSKDKTEDISENRIISEAIVRAWSILDETSRQALRVVHDRWISRFPRSFDLASDLERVERRFAANRYGGPRDYYRKALMLSQVILGTNGLGFNEAAIIEGDAILLNTADIFEKYLRNVISQAYSDAGYVITKGGIGTTSLYTDGTFILVPDIVIANNNLPLLIIDAKYKVPTASDHYQMAAYLSANGLNRGLLLAPLFEGIDIIVREYITSNRVVVREVYLPMTNLEATEEFLGTVVERFAA